MKAREFIDRVEHTELAAGIREAELRTSGEIRIFVSRDKVQEPVTAAQACFTQLGMEKTRDRNAVLIFVAPLTQKFAIVGDAGIHERCGDLLWREIADAMATHFRKQEFTAGLLAAVRQTGEVLARHFPRKPDDKNELPDQVVTG